MTYMKGRTIKDTKPRSRPKVTPTMVHDACAFHSATPGSSPKHTIYA